MMALALRTLKVNFAEFRKRTGQDTPAIAPPSIVSSRIPALGTSFSSTWPLVPTQRKSSAVQPFFWSVATTANAGYM
jgi:hypothetical protein